MYVFCERRIWAGIAHSFLTSACISREVPNFSSARTDKSRALLFAGPERSLALSPVLSQPRTLERIALGGNTRNRSRHRPPSASTAIDTVAPRAKLQTHKSNAWNSRTHILVFCARRARTFGKLAKSAARQAGGLCSFRHTPKK
jgi:hypothetical protein